MRWQFETSRPIISPELESEFLRVRAGLTPEQWQLPETMVATFQRPALARMRERVEHASESDAMVGSFCGSPLFLQLITPGAPAAAIAIEKAVARGVKNVLVIGAAGSLSPEVPAGSVVVIDTSVREDGVSHHYLPADVGVAANGELMQLLCTTLETCGITAIRGRSWTIDTPYRETVEALRRHRSAGALVVEMEAAGIFAVARVRGVRAALAVVVFDVLTEDNWVPPVDDSCYMSMLLASTDATLEAASRASRLSHSASTE